LDQKANVKTPQNISSILHAIKAARDRNCISGSRFDIFVSVKHKKNTASNGKGKYGTKNVFFP